MNLSATAAIDRLVQDWEDAELLRAAASLEADAGAEVRDWDDASADGLVDENFGTWL